MRQPGEVNGPKLGAVAPPLDPLAVRGGDGCCFFAGGGIGIGRAMPLVGRASIRVGQVCCCDRLRCGRRMHRPYGCRGFMVVVIRGGRVLFLCGWRHPGPAGRCLSCDNRRTVSCPRAAAIDCAADDRCIAPTGAVARAAGRCLSWENRRSRGGRLMPRPYRPWSSSSSA